MGTKMARVSKQDASAELQDQLDIIFWDAPDFHSYTGKLIEWWTRR